MDLSQKLGRWWRRGCGPVLAALALLVQVAAPPGFMVAGGPQGPALVVCTGHGPLMAPRHGKIPGQANNTVCPFAGHVAAPTPSLEPVHPPLALAFEAAPVQPMADLAPGRGLAAPPPPSQGPPLRL